MLPTSSRGTPVWKVSADTFCGVTGWGRAGIVPRIVEFLDSLQLVPWSGEPRTSHCHEVDVAILGANTLLGAFSLLRAARSGQRVFWGVQPGLEGFPVGLFDKDEMRDTIRAMLGGAFPVGGSPASDAVLAHQFVGRLPAGVMVPRQTAMFALAPQAVGDRQVILANGCFEALAPADSFSGMLHQGLSAKGRLIDLSTSPAGRHAILTKKIILTSMVHPFGRMTVHQNSRGQRYEWECAGIEALGTASSDYRRLGDALEAIAEDLAALGQPDF